MTMFTAKSLARVLLWSSLSLVAGGCQQAQSPESAQGSGEHFPKVSSQRLIRSTSYDTAQVFTGSIRAGNTTAIGFELAGKIKHLAVDSGNHVKQGDLLAELDTSLLEAEKRELQASLAQNRADKELAQSTLKRSLALKKQGYASAQQLDELKGQLSSLQAAEQRLRAAIDANALRIAKSTLVAPFDGVIAKRNNNLGEVVALGAPLFTLIQHNNPQAIVGVPVSLAQTLEDSQQLTLTVKETPYLATVAGIGAEVNPVTRTVPVRLTLPKDAKVINGELAYLHYNKTVDSAGFWVPISSLTDGLRGLWNLYVLVEQEPDQYLIERRDIEILYTRGDQAFIQGAVSEDERFVTQGLHKVVVGERVTLTTQVATR
ncbi:efflux RND transporter periplasmic adaptor subunit [Shewanella sp. Isolate7]|uniref:efflux RND transporter periplasmic adaptor subunit n=1 Tax=Shewanella sp. Isolate7 TaxID=2908528 RepID=UPI001EFE1F7A|nr:efflux RND transporter periplasmic adaptor subunit [Shewanella sp. Isolate7]MCG9723191.1 efflux RND transporter periplasmic adaptor subunit [Shewanella sp. Isolate7]